MYKGDTNRTSLRIQTQPPHQSRCIHVTVANTDTSLGEGCGDNSWLNRSQIEAERRHTLAQPIFVMNAVDGRSGLLQHAQQLQRKQALVSRDRVHALDEVSSSCTCRTRIGLCGERGTECFQVSYRRVHTGYILIDEGTGFNFPRRLVGNEILAEGREIFQKLATTPEKTHVR